MRTERGPRLVITDNAARHFAEAMGLNIEEARARVQYLFGDEPRVTPAQSWQRATAWPTDRSDDRDYARVRQRDGSGGEIDIVAVFADDYDEDIIVEVHVRRRAKRRSTAHDVPGARGGGWSNRQKQWAVSAGCERTAAGGAKIIAYDPTRRRQRFRFADVRLAIDSAEAEGFEARDCGDGVVEVRT